MEHKAEGKLSRDQKLQTGLQTRLQSDIKSLTKKATGLLQSMNDRLKDLRDKNYRIALEQQFITVQPSWPAADAQKQQQPRRLALEAGPAAGQPAETQPGSSRATGSSGSSGSAAAAEQSGAVVPRCGAAAGGDASAGSALGTLQVEREAALMSPYIQKEVVQNGMGLPGAPAVVLPKQVTADSWAMVLEYCRFHLVPGRSDKERRMFDERFIKVDTNLLCELTSAADALDMRPLVDLASRAIAKMIEGKSPDQIREAFRLPDDLTDEEKLEPLRTVADDPRIRMLNRLYARKRKELQERKAQLLQAQQQAQAWHAVGEGGVGGGAAAGAGALAGEAQQDTRSLDELLSFIEDDAGRGGRPGAKPSKSKKKKAKQKANSAGGPAALEGGEGSSGEPSQLLQVPAMPGGAAGIAAEATAGAAGEAAAAAAGEADHLVPPEPQPASSFASAERLTATRSPASTLPTGSAGDSCRTTSERSSLDSSPERHSMHSAHSVLSSATGSPAYCSMDLGPLPAGGPSHEPVATAANSYGAAMAAAVAADSALPQLSSRGSLMPPASRASAAAMLPLPPFWVPGLGGGLPPGAPFADWLEAEDDIMDDYGLDAADKLAVPDNPFAMRATLLHRPITSLTSLSAFRPSLLPGAPANAAPADTRPLATHPSPSRQLQVASGGETRAGAQAGTLGSLGTKPEAAAAGVLSGPSSRQQQEHASRPPDPAADAPQLGKQHGGGPAAAPGPLLPADTAAVSELLSSFLQDLGLQGQLHIAPGPGPGHNTHSAGKVGAPAPAGGGTLRSLALPGGGGVVELRWAPARASNP